MAKPMAKVWAKDNSEREIAGGVAVKLPPTTVDGVYIMDGLTIVDKDGEVLAWVNADETWLIQFFK